MAEMDSDDSRPGSSASNSSAESSANSDNSRPSSPAPPESPQKSPTSSHGSSSHKSRSRTSTTRSRSQSQSSSSSTDNEDNNDEQQFQQHMIAQQQQQQHQHQNEMMNSNNRSNSSRSSSSSRESSPHSSNRREGVVSRNQSISPARKSRSSRNSSVSSSATHESRRSDVNAHNTRRSPSNGPNDVNNDEGVRNNREEPALNMSHDDFSDVSDIEADGDRLDVRSPSPPQDKSFEDDETNHTDDVIVSKFERKDEDNFITDLRQKLDQKKNQLKAIEDKEKNEENHHQMKTNGTVSEELDDLVKKHDEDALDFEAEEGECQELTKEEEQIEKDNADKQKGTRKDMNEKEIEEGEELEEGEVTDEEEKRPEETEPKPICRFYTRGQCTWGMSCRFLHPGVTDKGNYTMFDMVRPVPVPPHAAPGGGSGGGGFGPHPYHDYRTERPPLHHRPPLHPHHPHIAPHYDPRVIPPIVQDTPVPVVESAWERGLRTAKEMMRKANKRKEQDMDFEDKKMNLTLSQDELEKDNYYIRDRGSPELSPPPPFVGGRHPPPPAHYEGAYSPPPPPPPPATKFVRGGPPAYEEDAYGRTTRYRELPPHRMPQYEDERRVRPAREVIVQRVEPVGRGDEWNDPWMRSKSPGSRHDRERIEKRVRRERRSYSSNSSYSSSSTSPSGSSSESSRSPSPETRRGRYNSTHSSSHKSPTIRRHIKTGLRSPSPRRRRSPSIRRSPVRKRHMSPSPVSEKRIPLSPMVRRKKVTSPPRKGSFEKARKRRRGSSSSGSESSDSSGSDSESTYSSSSGTSSRGNTPVKRPTKPIEKSSVAERKVIKKAVVFPVEPPPPKKRSPISIEIKKPSSIGTSALNSESNSMSSTVSSSKGKTARREELLKQLRAVEDAIARKRQKLN